LRAQRCSDSEEGLCAPVVPRLRLSADWPFSITELAQLLLVGKVQVSSYALDAKTHPGLDGIAHTLWATPRRTPNRQRTSARLARHIAIVHNGIIETTRRCALRQMLGIRLPLVTPTPEGDRAHRLIIIWRSSPYLLTAVRKTVLNCRCIRARGIDGRIPNASDCTRCCPAVIGLGSMISSRPSDVAALFPYAPLQFSRGMRRGSRFVRRREIVDVRIGKPCFATSAQATCRPMPSSAVITATSCSRKFTKPGAVAANAVERVP